MPAPLLYRAWVGLSVLLVPFFARSETRKLRAAGVPVLRAHEKLGHATEPRHSGVKYGWFHAASVGESLSVLALIHHMGVKHPELQFIITSGTASSAELIAKRLPPRTVHQFAPLDAPGPIKRFLKHWHPDAAIFVESELWPQMLRRTYATGARMALVNARLSEKSITTWRKMPRLARYMFEVFDLILTQNDAMAEAMVSIHAPPDRVARGINLKSMAGPLPVDEDLLFEARAALGHRPVWVASSTHEGEEQVVLKAHAELLKRWPDLCLILAPRHTDRARDAMNLIAGAGLSFTRRTRGDAPGEQVFLADTMGELGTWYALTDVVFLGGSLKAKGGHNAFEVAQSGAMTLSGPHIVNLAETYAQMEAGGAARLVATASDLVREVGDLLQSQPIRTKGRRAATAFAAAQNDQLDGIADRLLKALDLNE
jgi:3-deoxy-D-manno-octulosonic-acid transferase